MSLAHHSRLVLLALVLGSLLSLSPAHAQEAALLRGLVVDAETRQPVPFARVGVAGNRIGTSTNAEGRFALSIPAAYRGEQLEVAMLGYRRFVRALPPLPGPVLRVELQPSPAVLADVTVTSSVLDIVREAVARIPRNYSTRPTRLTGFYRESDNGLRTGQYQYLMESLLLVVKPPYQRPRGAGQVKLLQVRRAALPGGEVSVRWYAGPFIPHRFDFVQQRLDFINPGHFRDYTYRLAKQSSYNDRPVYVVEFGPRTGNGQANFEGRMYIAEDSYAFLGAEWQRTPAGLRHEAVQVHGTTLSMNQGTRMLERRYRVDYQPYAGRWHLQRVGYHTIGKAGQDTLRHLSEYLTTAIDTAQGPPIPYIERAQFEDIFRETAVPYDSTFWRGHTTLLPPEQLRRALYHQDRQQQAEQLFNRPEVTKPELSTEEKVFRFLGRLRQGATVAALPLRSPAARLDVAFVPTGSSFRAQGRPPVKSQRLVGVWSIDLQFDLVKALALRYSTYRAFQQYSGKGWELGLAFEHNLNPRHRPIFGRLGLAYSSQQLGRSLGTFDNSDAGLRVAGTRLDADEVSARIQLLSQALVPRLGLGVELSHKVQLVADLGYRLPLRTRTQLQLAEESGLELTRRSAELSLPASEVTFLVDGQPASTVPWQLERLSFGIGVLFRPL